MEARQHWNGNEGGYSRFCNEEEEEEDDKSCCNGNRNGNGIGFGFIEHRVSKLDTLAGIAIKYGVEVGDIKKMNGLVTDLQMYALNSIKIPLPGRHLPSPSFILNNNMYNNTTYRQISGMRARLPPSYSLNSRSSSSSSPDDHNISAAMSSLQGYYGLKPVATDDDDVDNDTEDTTAAAFLKHLCTNGVMVRKGRQVVSDDGIKPLHTTTSELLLIKEDNNGSSSGASGGAFSAGIAGCKGLALRSKARTTAAAETHQGVRKCSSTPSLQLDKTTRWGMKLHPDHVPTTRPIFDGLSLPNPTTAAWKRKAALD